ncbi:MAG: hypothetical protein B6U69_00770 [Thermofilum sp. ex4484_15]|nr:MAG: hypothetical protein B6U69_00770 [Thermofilum sp. ex4484_15]
MNPLLFVGLKNIIYYLVANTTTGAHITGIEAANSQEILRALASLAVLIMAAKALGEFFSSIGIAPVVGELLAGVIFGPYALGGNILVYGQPLVVINKYVDAFARMGVILLVFAAGLETTFSEFKKIGGQAFIVGLGITLVPLLASYMVCYSFLNVGTVGAIIMACALSATSTAIISKVLEEIGRLKEWEGKVLLNASVLNDVIVLALFSTAGSFAPGSVVSPVSFLANFVVALFMWAILMGIGWAIVPRFINQVTLLKIEGSVEAAAIVSAFALSSFAGALKLSPVVGAFAAGMAIGASGSLLRVKDFTRHLNLIFSPIFFSVMGAHLNLASLHQPLVLVKIVYLTSLVVISDLAGGSLIAYVFTKDRERAITVGLGAVPKGEVALIIAGLGAVRGMIGDEAYAELIAVSIITILLGPLLLSYLSKLGEKVRRERREVKGAIPVPKSVSEE